MSGEGLAVPAVTLNEAQAYVRIETGEEEAIVAGLIRTATALCEAFLNQVVVAREFVVAVPPSSSWQRLGIGPVQAISEVRSAGSALPTGTYAIDIDAAGDGWVRVTTGVSGRIEVTGTAGIAADQNGVPEPIRQGILRLVAHLFATRDGGGGDPPAAVTALWRPYRRMRLA